MTNYYDIQSAKLKIMSVLVEKGWKIYGFTPDQSDLMTDYYCPARWSGIATKNNFVLVIDQFSNSLSGKEVKTYNGNGEQVDYKKIQKLKATMEDNASSENEKEICKQKIENLRQKENANYKIVEVFPTFNFGNPKAHNWHIEKDGEIIAKGKGIGTIYNINNNKETMEKVNKFVSNIENKINSIGAIIPTKKEVTKKVIKPVETVINISDFVENQTVVKLNTTFTGGFYKGTLLQLVTMDNNRLTFVRLGKKFQQLKMYGAADNVFSVSLDKFTQWIEKAMIITIELKEVEEITTKTVYVKATRKGQNENLLPAEPVEETQTQTETNITIETVNAGAVTEQETAITEQEENNSEQVQIEVTMNDNKERNSIELFFTSIPSEEIRTTMKSLGFRWARFNKCWYKAKPTKEHYEFCEKLTATKTSNNDTNSSFEYKEIELTPIESYTISKELQKREHDANWIFRRKEIDHEKELHQYFNNIQEKAITVLEEISDKKTRYELLKSLEYFKKHYHETKIKYLSQKANCPSWAVTGAAGRNMNSYNKKMEQIDNTTRRMIELDKEINERIENAKWNALRREEKAIQQKINNIDLTIEFTSKKVEVELYGRKQKIQAYIYNNYIVLKRYGHYRVFLNGQEIHICKSKDTLETAKKFVLYHLEKQLQTA